MRPSCCQAPPPSLPRPHPRLPHSSAGSKTAGGYGPAPGGGRGDRPGGPGSGWQSTSLALGPERGEPQAERVGGEGGRARSNFPLFSFILPCEKIKVSAPRCFPPGAQRPGGFVPSLVSQTLISDSLPAPAPVLFPNSYGSLPCPRPAAARHQQGLSVQSRVAAPEGAGGPPRAPSAAGSA